MRFSICLADSICADALDMLPCGNEIYIISSFEQSEKHIDFAKQKYRAIEDSISTKYFAVFIMNVKTKKKQSLFAKVFMKILIVQSPA